MTDSDVRTVQSVETACEIIDYLHRHTEAQLSAIADSIGKADGTVHTHLATLKQFGYITQDDGGYQLGPQFISLGEHIRHHSALYTAASEQVDALAVDTGEAAHLIIEHQGRLFTMYEQFGAEAVGVEYHTKKRARALDHLHCTAAGKAILAHSDERRLVTMIERNGLPELTPHTITKIDDLMDSLEGVRDRGYAFADEEQSRGLRAVGAPVLDPSGTVRGAVAVSGPVSRLRAERFRATLPERVLEAADLTEFELQSEEREESI
jgi:DNA-binding IclR family transcriptional regulator